MEPGRFRAFADFNWSPGPAELAKLNDSAALGKIVAMSLT